VLGRGKTMLDGLTTDGTPVKKLFWIGYVAWLEVFILVYHGILEMTIASTVLNVSVKNEGEPSLDYV
jgi:hypothetical protein